MPEDNAHPISAESSAPAPWYDRLFDRMAFDSPEIEKSLTLAVQAILLNSVAIFIWGRVASLTIDLTYQFALVGLPFAFAALLLFHKGWRQHAHFLAFLVLFVVALPKIPGLANHHYLFMYFNLIFALCNTELERDRRIAMAAMRWVFVIVVAGSGIQKALHGTYLLGVFPAYMAVHFPQTTEVASLLIPSADMERLEDYSEVPGQGPFLVKSPLFVLLSNAVYIGEILIPSLVIFPKLRKLGVVLLGLMFGSIAVLSRELTFGTVMWTMILSFSTLPNWWKWILRWQVVFATVFFVSKMFFPFLRLN